MSEAGQFMDQGTIAIITAGLAAVITILGWNVSHYLAKRREDRTRRIENRINRLERQIEDIYGPLLSLIEQIFNVWRVRQKIFEKVNDGDKGKIDDFVWSQYFFPLHVEIRELLKKKYYLVDDQSVASSIREYLEHSTQELFQNRISRELYISTSELEGKRWPQSLYPDVENAIAKIRDERRSLIRDLEITSLQKGRD